MLKVILYFLPKYARFRLSRSCLFFIIESHAIENELAKRHMHEEWRHGHGPSRHGGPGGFGGLGGFGRPGGFAGLGGFGRPGGFGGAFGQGGFGGRPNNPWATQRPQQWQPEEELWTEQQFTTRRPSQFHPSRTTAPPFVDYEAEQTTMPPWRPTTADSWLAGSTRRPTTQQTRWPTRPTTFQPEWDTTESWTTSNRRPTTQQTRWPARTTLPSTEEDDWSITETTTRATRWTTVGITQMPPLVTTGFISSSSK
jgi:hypothetical protein